MRPARLRLGALLWLLTLQFFVVETVVAAAYDGYSRIDDPIGLLGSSSVSPEAALMNASFVVQGVLMLGGLVLLRPLLLGRGGPVATAVLAVAAAGAVVMGLLPLDEGETWHRLGTALLLAGSGIGLVALAYAVRPRSEAVGTALALLGLASSAMTVFYITAVTGLLGEGGTQRATVYPLPLGLALAALALLLLGNRPLATARAQALEGGTDRRAERQRARTERARRARERDEALQAAAARAEADRRATAGTPEQARPADPDADPADPADHPDTARDDDFNPDDPWAAPRRRDP